MVSFDSPSLASISIGEAALLAVEGHLVSVDVKFDLFDRLLEMIQLYREQRIAEMYFEKLVGWPIDFGFEFAEVVIVVAAPAGVAVFAVAAVLRVEKSHDRC